MQGAKRALRRKNAAIRFSCGYFERYSSGIEIES
jgi:hypothetical protein